MASKPDFMNLETTQGPIVVRRLAIDMVVPVSESETVVTVGNAQLIVKATLEELDLGVQVAEGWFRPLADAPDKLEAMRSAGVTSRVTLPTPAQRGGRKPVAVTPREDLPQTPPSTRIAAPTRKPAPRAPAPDGSDVAPDLAAQVEKTARAAAEAFNPELARPKGARVATVPSKAKQAAAKRAAAKKAPRKVTKKTGKRTA